jgi:hypothetical protein
MLFCVAMLLVVTTTALEPAEQDQTPPTSETLTLPVSRLKSAVPRGDGIAPRKPTANAGRHDDPGGDAATGGVPGIESLTNFVDSFTTPGFDGAGNPQSVWPYSMVGRAPERNQTTRLNAPVIPVVLDLLLPNGSVFISFDGNKDLKKTLKSPVFEPSSFRTGFTQITDAMMRAQFWNRIPHDGEDDEDGGYHNLLVADPKPSRHMRVPFRTAAGQRAWFVFVDGTGAPVLSAVDFDTFVNLLFPATVPVDNTTLIGAAELAGDMTTRDLTTFLFDNVALFQGNINNCCILGFHSYDFEPGDVHNGNRDRRFVFDFASWVSPGLFLFGFEDVTGLSHEVAETFADPFVDNATPWWEVVDPFAGFSICQNNLEVGDVIEVLTSLPVYSVQMNDFTYHPQNVAMLPWFAFQSPSPAAKHAYSFPDETTLMSLSPGPLLPGCVPQ